VGSKPVFIEMDVPKVECQDCSVRRRVFIGFATFSPKNPVFLPYSNFVLINIRSVLHLEPDVEIRIRHSLPETVCSGAIGHDDTRMYAIFRGAFIHCFH
jgi:hypothetical protein